MRGTLYPGRVDIGVGRAPGGPAEVSEVLSDNFLQGVFSMPDLLEDLIRYIDDADEKIKAGPLPPVKPDIWMLGTSGKSAKAAAGNGLYYAFGQFMSDAEGKDVIDEYRKSFKLRSEGQVPYAIVTLSVICAETADKAAQLANSYLVWQVKKDREDEFEHLPSLKAAEAAILSPDEE